MSNKQVVKNAIFVCAGDNETFASYCINNLLNNFDLIINFFGNDDTKFDYLKQHSKFIIRSHNTKFLALKKIYDSDNHTFDKYAYVVCFDDDAIITNGNINTLIQIAQKFSIDAMSPAQDINGKLSHIITKKYPGNHIFRYTNFIEMNFPVFKTECLKQYLQIHDGLLCGYGNDWWFLNTIEANLPDKYNCGICDSVVVLNPLNATKKNNIDDFLSRKQRVKQWTRVKKKYNLTEWNKYTKGYIHLIDNELTLTPKEAMP